jgi:hypothetical protein
VLSKEELDFRIMQQRVVNSLELKGNTKYVHTAKFCVDNDQPGTDDYTSYHGRRAHTIIAVGRLWKATCESKCFCFFGCAMFGFVVFVAFTRGGISQARLLRPGKIQCWQ